MIKNKINKHNDINNQIFTSNTSSTLNPYDTLYNNIKPHTRFIKSKNSKEDFNITVNTNYHEKLQEI